MLTIKNIKFSYRDEIHQIEHVDFIDSLIVESCEYNCVLCALQQARPEDEDIKILSFTHD